MLDNNLLKCPINLKFDYDWGTNGIAKFIIDQDDPALWLIECPGIIH